MSVAHFAGWTEERVESLKALWDEGLSCSQIARKLGGGLTRNAVIGKVHRLDLLTRAVPSRTQRVHVPRRTSSRPPRAVVAMRSNEPPPEVQGAPGEFPANGHCKWTEDDPMLRDRAGQLTFRMCGHKTSGPLDPWCAFHTRKSVGQTPVRRDREISDEAQLNSGIKRAFG